MGQGDMGQSQSDRPELMLLPVDSVNERQRLVINRMLDGFEGFLSTSKYAQLAKSSKDKRRASAIRYFVLPHGHRIDDGEELIGRYRRTTIKLHSTVFTNEPHPKRWR